MKASLLALAALWIATSSTYAATRPDFTGRFDADDGTSFIVRQSGCEQITISQKTNGAAIDATFTYLLDGKRYELVPSQFWAAYWNSDRFMREVWSATEGGARIGFDTEWMLFDDAAGSFVRQRLIDEQDGTIVSTRIFHKHS